MTEALAHDTLFPHVHPHARFSALEDLAFTLLFLAIVLAIGRGAIALLRRVAADSRRRG